MIHQQEEKRAVTPNSIRGAIRRMLGYGGRMRRAKDDKYGVAAVVENVIVVVYRVGAKGSPNQSSLAQSISYSISSNNNIGEMNLLVLATPVTDHQEELSVSQIVEDLKLYELGLKSFDVIISGSSNEEMAQNANEYIKTVVSEL
jgi:hypothetical protein